MTSPFPVVLGLCSYTHDSAAALLVNGELVGFVEEERLSQIKHTRDYPHHAVRWLLREAGITAADVDAIAYNFCGPRYLDAVPDAARLLCSVETRGRALPRAAGFAKVALRTARRVQVLGRMFPGARVRPVLHHRTHQMYAFAASGWDAAAVLVVDSLGETQTTTVAVARQRTPASPRSALYMPCTIPPRSPTPTARSPNTWAGGVETRRAP